MSHNATNWAIKQRGLKPATKIVLWNLADRHNKDTKRCDPTQELLAYDCEMVRSTVNLHLTKLESKGLIRRVQRVNPKTGRQENTSYQLAFDCEITVSENETRTPDVVSDDLDLVPPCPKTGHGSVSEKQPIPCPKNGDSRVRNSDTNLVREPVREPCVDEQHTHKLFQKFWKAHPRPREAETTEAAFMAAVASGVDPDWIVSSAKKYATEQKGNRTQYVKRSDNWLADELWKAFPRKIKTTGVGKLDFYADKRYSDAQMMGILKQAESGVPVSELCREHGMMPLTGR